ncbi:MAG: hypothetical protein KY429_00265 [Actinobacteria bacterium]|nr:hypothetical protein [Actinomycetota bacterium]
MSSPRFGGMTAILSGLLVGLWVITSALDYDLFFALVPAALVFLVLSIPSMHAVQQGKHGAAGKIGYGLMMAAGAVLAVMFLFALIVEGVMEQSIEDDFSALDTVFPIVFFVFLAGLILFGIASAVAGVLPRLAVIAFMLAFPLGLAIDFATGAMDQDEAGIGFYIGIGLLSVSLLWLGSFLWSRSAPSAATPG